VEQRELRAKDVFRAGSAWEQALVNGCRDVLIPQIRKDGGKSAVPVNATDRVLLGGVLLASFMSGFLR
jgi:hypothetical protein